MTSGTFASLAIMGGGLEDTLAEIISWVALIVVPIVLVGLFWFVHILPEKYAHKRDHPQKEAIKILCVMSLFFGGLLWPIAFVWAFMKTPRVQVVEAGEVGGSGGEEVSHA